MAADIGEAAASALARALAPRTSPFERLGLPTTAVDETALRRAYRAAALLLHPDKCQHPQAKLAFQRASEAFDALSDLVRQRQLLQPALGGQRSGRGRGRGRPRSAGPSRFDVGDPAGTAPQDHFFDWEREEDGDEDPGPRGAAKGWWDSAWSEFEKRLRQREMEAQQERAIEAAVLRGEDSLDAYMATVLQEVTRGPAPTPPSPSAASPSAAAAAAPWAGPSSAASTAAPAAASRGSACGSSVKRPRHGGAVCSSCSSTVSREDKFCKSCGTAQRAGLGQERTAAGPVRAPCRSAEATACGRSSGSGGTVMRLATGATITATSGRGRLSGGASAVGSASGGRGTAAVAAALLAGLDSDGSELSE